MQDENLPLVPRSRNVQDHSVEGILVDVFQDVLKKQRYPPNVLHNVSKYKVESKQVHRTAQNVKMVAAETLLRMKDIEIVEEKLMFNCGKYIARENAFDMINCHNEKRLLGRKLLFPEIQKEDVSKYGLILASDLFPHRFNTAMDFKLNKNTHLCNPCLSDVDLIPTKLTKHDPPVEYKKHVTIKKQSKPEVKTFLVESECVVFYNFELNKTYKRRFRVLNISGKSEACYIETMPHSKYFFIEETAETLDTKIPPGMHAVFVITFKTDCYINAQDFCVLKGTIGTAMKIKLASYRDPPNLYMVIHRNTLPVKYVDDEMDAVRAVALNTNIDCGACLLGDSISIKLMCKNCGGSGDFFFMSEDDWVFSDVIAMHDNLELEAGGFIIKPAYFNIDHDEYILIHVLFLAKQKGLNLQSIMLLCNNISYVQLDVIADAVMFDEYCIALDCSEFIGFEYLQHILYPIKSVDTLYEDDNIEVLYEGAEFEKDSIILGECEMNYESSENYTEITLVEVDAPPNTPTENIINYLTKFKNQEQNEEDGSFKKTKKYLLYLSSCLCGESNVRTITIHNNCFVDLFYYWEVNDLRTYKFGNYMIHELNKDCVNIEKCTESLAGYSTSEFDFVITPDSIQSGFYGMILSLYIKSVPKCAIRHKSQFHFVDSHRGGQIGEFVDVLIAEIFILCKIEPLLIELDPYEFILTEPLDYKGTFKTHFNVMVKNENNIDLLNCVCVVSNPKLISVEPQTFLVLESESVTIDVQVSNEGYENIDEVIEVIVGKCYKQEFRIHADVKKPMLKFDGDFMIFGCIALGSTYSKTMIIKNDNYVDVEWEIWESYDNDDNRNGELIATCLDNGNIEIEYIIYATEPIDWIAVLSIYITYNGDRYLSSTLGISYQVEKLQVHMHTTMSKCAILCPDELLFVNAESKFTLCLHNFSKAHANFRFGTPYGAKSDLVEIETRPSYASLQPNGAVRIDIYLTPSRVGFLDEVYLPCLFENLHPAIKQAGDPFEPIILTILCAVEEIFVKIRLPRNRDDVFPENELVWPPQMIYEFDNSYDVCDDFEDTKEQLDEQVSIKKPALEEETEEKTETVINDIASYLNTIVSVGEENDGNLDVPQNTPKSVTETESDSVSTSISNRSLRYLFDDDLNVNEHVLEIYDIPLRTPIKKTIIIENVTPIVGVVNAEIQNYKPLEVQKTRIDEFLVEMKLKADDYWARLLPPCGIAIKLQIANSVLCPFSSTKLDIWIYANTWGVYADEILIEINEILPLAITLFVEVVGLPLEFPIAATKNSVFRFGMIPYKSNSLTRKIYVKNTCAIPVCVVWHIFMKSVNKNNEPITVFFDMFHPNIESKLSSHDSLGNLIISHPMHANKSESFIFNAAPKESYVKPGDMTFINVVFNPKAYSASFDKKDIEAYLIGYISLPLINKHKPGLLVRKSGSQMQPMRMKMVATLELPILKLEMIRGELMHFKYACDLALLPMPPHVQVLVFKNFSSTPAIVHMEIEEPFRVLVMRTADHETCENFNFVKVQPNECVEVHVQYHFKSKDVQTIGNILHGIDTDSKHFIPNTNTLTQTYSVTKNLNIKQEGFIKQVFPMTLTIYYPIINATKELDFEMVFVGCCKKLVMTIRNYTTCKVPFKIEENPTFAVVPSEGVLDACLKTDPYFWMLLEYKVYEEIITINTNINAQTIKVTMTGVGLHDEKHFEHDRC